MEKETWNLIGGFILGGIASIVIMAFLVRADYQNGQIDALTGNIHYELITHPDSTRTWERIE